MNLPTHRDWLYCWQHHQQTRFNGWRFRSDYFSKHYSIPKLDPDEFDQNQLSRRLPVQNQEHDKLNSQTSKWDPIICPPVPRAPPLSQRCEKTEVFLVFHSQFKTSQNSNLSNLAWIWKWFLRSEINANIMVRWILETQMTEYQCSSWNNQAKIERCLIDRLQRISWSRLKERDLRIALKIHKPFISTWRIFKRMSIDTWRIKNAFWTKTQRRRLIWKLAQENERR